MIERNTYSRYVTELSARVPLTPLVHVFPSPFCQDTFLKATWNYFEEATTAASLM